MSRFVEHFIIFVTGLLIGFVLLGGWVFKDILNTTGKLNRTCYSNSTCYSRDLVCVENK